jgi:hypothetical protein
MYPAPSMAELWRELPRMIVKNGNFYLKLEKGDLVTAANYISFEHTRINEPHIESTNPQMHLRSF